MANTLLDQFMMSLGRSVTDLRSAEDAYNVISIYSESDLDAFAPSFGYTSGREMKIALEDAVDDFANRQLAVQAPPPTTQVQPLQTEPRDRGMQEPPEEQGFTPVRLSDEQRRELIRSITSVGGQPIETGGTEGGDVREGGQGGGGGQGGSQRGQQGGQQGGGQEGGGQEVGGQEGGGQEGGGQEGGGQEGGGQEGGGQEGGGQEGGGQEGGGGEGGSGGQEGGGQEGGGQEGGGQEGGGQEGGGQEGGGGEGGSGGQGGGGEEEEDEVLSFDMVNPLYSIEN